MGWAAKSTGEPCRPCQADKEGSKAEGRSWLRVSSEAGRRSLQRSGGKVMCAEERIERKWFFPVRMDRSALLAR